MEEKKGLSVFDIINICVLGVGIVLLAISLFTEKTAWEETRIIMIITTAAMGIALISGIIYMILRYTKKGNVLYKIFMYAFVLTLAMNALLTMTFGSGSMLISIIIIAILVLSAILATGKDLGRIKTFIIAALLLIGQIVMIVISIKNEVFVLADVTLFILILEACLMVFAKYRDKALRGTK